MNEESDPGFVELGYTYIQGECPNCHSKIWREEDNEGVVYSLINKEWTEKRYVRPKPLSRMVREIWGQIKDGEEMDEDLKSVWGLEEVPEEELKEWEDTKKEVEKVRKGEEAKQKEVTEKEEKHQLPQCNDCGKEFLTTQALQIHKKLKHMETKEEEINKKQEEHRRKEEKPHEPTHKKIK